MPRGLYVPVYVSLPRHRKTIKAAATLKCSRHELLGHLLELWCWALTNAEDGGYMPNVTAEEIAYAAAWEGDPAAFASALHAGGFLDRVKGGYAIHDWHEYGGKLLREQEKDRLRKSRISGGPPPERARSSTGKATGIPPGIPPVDETRRDEKRRDETPPLTPPQDAAPPASDQDTPELPPDDEEEGEDRAHGFPIFFAAYLRQEQQEEARTAWTELTPQERMKALGAVARWSAWKKRTVEPRYWPLPASWLRKKLFTDRIPAEPTAPASAGDGHGLPLPCPDDQRDFGGSPPRHERWNDYMEAMVAAGVPEPWPRFLPWLNEDIKRRVQARTSANLVKASKPHEAHEPEVPHVPTS